MERSERGPLGSLADRIRADSPLPVFPVFGGISVEDSILWEGQDVGSFLSFAKRVGARVIYLNEVLASEDSTEPELEAHAGETASVGVSFLLDGEFHTFFQLAPWAESAASDELSDETDFDDTAGAVEILDKRRAEFSESFLERARKEGIEPDEPHVDAELRSFLAPLLSTPKLTFHYSISRAPSSLDRKIRELASQLASQLAKEEAVKISQLVPALVEWAGKLGIRSLSRGDVEAYLLETGASLSRSGIRLVWTKAKLQVKLGPR